MAIGRVNAQSGLILRNAPGGQRIGGFANGTRLEILNRQEDWLQVRSGNQVGFVSGDFVTVESDALAPGAPVGNDAFRVMGRDVLGPDGTVFAKTFRKGVFNLGRTSIGAFVIERSERFPDVSQSLLRVMEAVSDNEGKLEAINTWDNAFLTFGCFQWTVGVGTGTGELPGLLERLKLQAPAVFDEHFGRFGLDVVDLSGTGIRRGRFSLDGQTLSSSEDKERLRTFAWAHRFWTAGHAEEVRETEIRHASGRLDDFYRNPRKRLRGRDVADYVTSEYGVALLLDQHVNRPAHVPRTLAAALDALLVDGLEEDPTGWDTPDEMRLIKRYLALRHETSMTDSRSRAENTLHAVRAGKASDQRGSFVP